MCFWVGTPPHPTASAVLGVGKARAGQRSPRHSSDGPHHWLCLQPNPHCECVAPTKAAASLPAVIKAFHCIIDRCVSPWEAADAGCSTTAFHNLGLMINSHVQLIRGITELRFLPTEMSVLAAKLSPQSLDNLYFSPWPHQAEEGFLGCKQPQPVPSPGSAPGSSSRGSITPVSSIGYTASVSSLEAEVWTTSPSAVLKKGQVQLDPPVKVRLHGHIRHRGTRSALVLDILLSGMSSCCHSHDCRWGHLQSPDACLRSGSSLGKRTSLHGATAAHLQTKVPSTTRMALWGRGCWSSSVKAKPSLLFWSKGCRSSYVNSCGLLGVP